MAYRLVHQKQGEPLVITMLTETFSSDTDEKAAYEEYARNRLTDPAISWEVLPISTASGDRYFRDAWEYIPGANPGDTGTIGVDMTIARAIIRDHVRELRKPMLEALDVEVLRAQETGDDTTDIVRRKQQLRDLPQAQAIEDATTPQELLRWWPEATLGELDTTGRAYKR